MLNLILHLEPSVSNNNNNRNNSSNNRLKASALLVHLVLPLNRPLQPSVQHPALLVNPLLVPLLLLLLVLLPPLLLVSVQVLLAPLPLLPPLVLLRLLLPSAQLLLPLVSDLSVLLLQLHPLQFLVSLLLPLLLQMLLVSHSNNNNSHKLRDSAKVLSVRLANLLLPHKLNSPQLVVSVLSVSKLLQIPVDLVLLDLNNPLLLNLPLPRLQLVSVVLDLMLLDRLLRLPLNLVEFSASPPLLLLVFLLKQLRLLLAHLVNLSNNNNSLNSNKLKRQFLVNRSNNPLLKVLSALAVECLDKLNLRLLPQPPKRFRRVKHSC